MLRSRRDGHGEAHDPRLSVVSAGVVLVLVLLARVPGSWPGLRSVLAAGLLVAWPVLVGGWVRWWRTWPWGPELVLRLAVGGVTLVALAVGFEAAGAFSVGRVVAVGLLLAVPALLVDLRSAWSHRGSLVPVRRPRWSTAAWLTVGLLGVEAVVGYWRAWSPYPYFTTWDGFLHVSVVRRMLEWGEFSLALGDLSPAFTFDAYLPAYHLDLAGASALSGVPPLGVLWGGPFATCAVVAVGVFALHRAARRPVVVAGLSTAVTGLLLTARKSTNPLLDTLPASLVVALAPLALLCLTDPDRRRGLRRGLCTAALLLPFHGLVAALLLGVVLASWLLHAVCSSPRVSRSGWLPVVAGVLGVACAVLYFLPFSVRAHLEGVVLDPTTFYARLTPSSDLRQRLFLSSNDYAPGFLGVVTLLAVVFLVRDARAGSLTPVRALPVVVLCGFVTPVVGLERLEGFLWLVAGLVLGAVLEVVVVTVRARVSGRSSLVLPSAAAVGVAALLLPVLVRPVSALHDLQLRDTSARHRQSSFAPYELHALRHYARRYGRSLPVVSDPMTQQAAEGLALLDSIGGVATSAEEQLTVARAVIATTPAGARRSLTALQERHGPFLLVVTGRTERWAHQFVARYRTGVPLSALGFGAVYRPWSLSETSSDPEVGEPARELLAPLRSSGCVRRESGRREVVLLRIDCERQGRHAR